MKLDEVRTRFFDSAVADVLRAFDGGAIMGANILALCVFDYLTILCGRSGRSGYRHTVEDYLRQAEPRYKPEWVYAIRCALVHVHGHGDAMKEAKLDAFTFAHHEPGLHLQKTWSPTALWINADDFATEVVWATKLFFDDGRITNDIEKNARKLLVVSNANPNPRPYVKMHRNLSVLDEPTPTLRGLRDSIRRFPPQLTAY